MALKKLISIFTIFILLIINTYAQQLGPAPYYLMPEQVSVGASNLNKLTTVFSPTATCNRQTIINDYTTNYVGSSVTSTELAWTGSVGSCTPGVGSALSVTRTLQRINYFRRLVGLQDNITFDQTSYEAGCQAASLIFDAQNNLSHTPPNTWTCWTQTGYDYAGLSNIALGIHSSDAITGYIQENGASNAPAGHRRWIFYSRASVFGTGSTYDAGGANDLRVLSVPTNNSPVLPSFTAYPCQGYFPRSLMFTRWSFGISGANFSAATVSMTNEAGSTIAITQNPYSFGYGDNSITWDIPANVIPSSGDLDVVFNVTVSGITGAAQTSYTYKVIAIKEATPTTVITPTHPTCGNNGSATVAFSAGAKSYLWSNNSTSATISNVGVGTYSVTVTDKNDCAYTQSTTLTDNSAAVILPGSATPSSSFTKNTGTLNLSTTGSSNVTTGKIVGWWITRDNPITTTVTNQSTLNTATAAALIEPSSITTSNTSFMYKSTSGTSLTKVYNCGTELDATKNYYATPIVSDYIASTAALNCTSNVNGTNVSIGGIGVGRWGTILGSSFTCGSTPPPTFSLVITISGYSGPGINFNVRPSDNSYTFAFPSLSANGTVTLTESQFPANYDPKTSGIKVLAYQGSGGDFPAGTTMTIQFTINYPATPGIPFPTMSYSTCTFGTPLMFTCASVIPIELLNFKGRTNKNVNTLTWATASEKDNAYFIIERSVNGQDFSKLAEVKGAGTSNHEINYVFDDAAPIPGTNYYRLIQVDFDGKQTYSQTISFNRDKKTNLTIYPNPTNGIVHISTGNDSEEQIEITNLMGEVVLKTTINDAKSLDLSTLSAGIYVIRTSNGVVQRVTKY